MDMIPPYRNIHDASAKGEQNALHAESPDALGRSCQRDVVGINGQLAAIGSTVAFQGRPTTTHDQAGLSYLISCIVFGGIPYCLETSQLF